MKQAVSAPSHLLRQQALGIAHVRTGLSDLVRVGAKSILVAVNNGRERRGSRRRSTEEEVADIDYESGVTGSCPDTQWEVCGPRVHGLN